MKALQVVRHGRPSEALEIVDLPLPEPGPGAVRIRVSAATLNFNDVDRCYGRTTTVKPPLPFTLGMDVAGVVDAAGEGGETWLGKRVCAITSAAMGGLADFALAPLDSVFEAPDELDDAEAAGFLIPFQTMHLALHRRARLASGEVLLVHAGASGLGSAAIQLGVAAGARVFATAGGPAKTSVCRELGAEIAIDSKSEEFTDRILDATDGHGADVICDLVGGSFTQASWNCIAREGRYLPIGFAADPENGMTGVPLRPTCTANFSVVGVMLAWVSNVPLPIRKLGLNPFGRDVAEAVHADLTRLLTAKQIRPLVERRVGLAEAAIALEDHEAGTTIGRTAVVMETA